MRTTRQLPDSAAVARRLRKLKIQVQGWNIQPDQDPR